MEELIMKISSRLISVKPDKFDSVINQALQDLGKFVEADRCYVFQYKDNGRMMDNTHEWCREGVESLIARLQKIPTESFNMVNTPQKRRKVYNIPVVSDIPEDFRTDREEFKASGIKSILSVPMLFQKETIGFLGFDSVRKERNWSRDTISLLKIVGEMIAGAIARKKAVEALGSSEERYRQLVEHATEGIVVAQGRSTKFANPRVEEITSYSREELLSKPFLEFIHPDDRQLVIDNQQKRLKGELTPKTYEIRMINKYGETRWLRIGGVIINWEGKPASLNFVVDITENKRLKELESRAQRLEAAGQIAGQVAHDLNNLLAPLIAYPEFIREDLPKGHSVLPYLNDMEKMAQQIADINQQLLTLGRRGHYNLEPMNLNNLIRETLSDQKPFPKTLVIETDLDGELLNIKAGQAQIHRMLSNIIHNARDATQDIGHIVIKSENFYADNVSVAFGNVPQGEYVKLTISDTGHGISEDITQKIFDPFFTTKTADKKRGSGLGLSVVDAVVKDHKGYIDLESKIGSGTIFYFYFPVTREGIDDSESEPITGGSEKVLVVDDDEMQRVVTLKILNSLGYTASAVESGVKAIDLLNREPQDLLVLDMIMPPGIDGAETFEKALKVNPSQKALIVSGYAETDRVQSALQLGAGAFIRKPLTRGKLARAVRRELNRKEKDLSC
jgi:PAS domain S-box-containing protein